jgi:acetolactate synthase I/II/III large subunit
VTSPVIIIWKIRILISQVGELDLATKLSDYIFQFIANQGVKHVFMVPGGGAMHLNDSLGKCRDIEYVCNLHEQACAIAAEAYARVTNNLGVALVTTGPGGTNAITGVAGAWLESTPCLIISGQVKRADMKGDLEIRQRGPQELDIISIVKSITKYAVTVMDPNTIRYHLEKALALATSGRKGPVWIDIPLDVQAAMIEPGRLQGFNPKEMEKGEIRSSKLASQVEKTIRFLNNSNRPVLLVGNGVRLAGAEGLILELVKILGIPVLTTWMGIDLISDECPLFFGKPGTVAGRSANFIIQNSDCLISIGARLDFAVTGFDQTKFARAAKKIVVDVDPGELQKLKMKVDLPVCIDARTFIQEFLNNSPTLLPRGRNQWLLRCMEWKAKYPVVLPEYWGQNKYVNVYVFTTLLSEELTANDLIIPGSSGADIDKFWISFQVKAGQRLFSTGGLGAMGFGVPASIGGCLASGRKRTITVDGDGGFQLNIQELETIARLQLPIKFFVFSNQGYSSIRSSQNTHFNGHLVGCSPSSGLTFPDTIKIAAAYGITSLRISDHSNLHDNIRAVLRMPGPVICDVMTDPEMMVAPRVSSHVCSDGSIVSRPMEDLWPFLDRDEFFSNMLIPPISESE